MLRQTFALTVLVFCLAAHAQDYDREKRMEAEIVPALMVGDAVRLRVPGGREFLGIYAKADPAKGAIVLVHGRSVHPDHELIGALRMKLHDAGYTTLAIQMPVLAAEKVEPADFKPLMPEAAGRIAASAAWLEAKGEGPIFLLSHSLGSWMAGEYFAAHRNSQFRAWVSIGQSSPYDPAVATGARPILDVYGDADLPAVLQGAAARKAVVDRAAKPSRQVRVPGAVHMFTAKESELSAVVAGWLADLPSR